MKDDAHAEATIAASTWPASRLGDALLAFLPATLTRTAIARRIPADVAADRAATGRWIAASARRLGVEAVAFNVRYPDLLAALPAAGAMLMRLPDDGEPRFLVLLAGRRGQISLLGPDHRVRKVSPLAVRSALCSPDETRVRDDIAAVLPEDGSIRADETLRAALRDERLRTLTVDVGWIVRMPAYGPFARHVMAARIPHAIALFMFVYLASHIAWISAWLMVGEDALQGRFDPGWVLAGGLMLATFMALRVVADRLQFLLSLRVGVLLRQRVFEGALEMPEQEVRGEGMGRILGRIFDAESVESLAVNGGLAATTAVGELVIAIVILGFAAQAWAVAVLLMLAILTCGVIGVHHWRAGKRWTDIRRDITNDLVERMVGHRTRLAQEDLHNWHEQEDRALDAYLIESRNYDRSAVWLMTFVPRGWLLTAAIGLSWSFAAGAPNDQLVIAIAGMLLAFDSLRNLVQGLPPCAGALIAWRQMIPLLRAAAAGTGGAGRADPATMVSRAATPALRVEARQLVQRQKPTQRQVLGGVSLAITSGDRILLEGASGGGKSTLASLIAGLQHPDEGVVLLDGLDLATLGENAWRRRIALTAQFHENHVVSETFAFNLLMGRNWPPSNADLDEAEALCKEMGLGPLLERMPSGIYQMVGESGWQLSHGERSRLFLARSLLQGADLIILDESFAALDPESLAMTMACVRRRARALIVIAHP